MSAFVSILGCGFGFFLSVFFFFFAKVCPALVILKEIYGCIFECLCLELPVIS